MRWHEAPLLPLSAGIALGILSGGWAAAAPAWLLAAGGLLFGLGACALALGRLGAAAVILLALAVVLGALRAATDPLPADHIARVALAPVVNVEGRLAEDPVRWAPDRTRLTLDVDAVLDGADRRPASGRLQVTLYGETAAVGEGQRVAVDLRLSRPRGFRNPGAFDYPAFLRREGILLVGTGQAESLVPLTPDESPWPVRIKRWAVATIGAHLPETSAALLAGLILGEKTGLPREGGDPKGWERA
jgi:competence protein ComEC